MRNYTPALNDFHGMEMLPPAKAAVLVAVLRQERPTVRNLMAETGLQSTSTVHKHLKWLKEAGLVDWQTGRRGSLRSTLSLAAAIPYSRYSVARTLRS